MGAILRVMIKSLVTPFYRSHAGLLFFVFFIMFGIVESTQLVFYHQSLIYGVLTSWIFLWVVMTIWALWNFKALHFILKTSSENSYQFLNQLALFPFSRIFSYYVIIGFLTFLPVFEYTLAIYAIGIQNGFYDIVGFIFIFQLVLWISNAAILAYILRNQHVAPRLTLPSFALPFQQSYAGIYIGYLIKEEKMALILSKAFSLILIYLVKETLEAGDDFRILGLTWLFALLSHTFLIYKVKVFEDQSLRWIRNLPVTTSRLYITYFQLYALLILPELLLLISRIGQELSIIQFFLLPVFAAGFFIFIHVYLFTSNRNADQYPSFLFWLFIICFMLILSKLIWMVTLLLMASSFILLKRRYFHYEPGNY